MPLWGWVLVFWVFFSILTTLGVVVYGETEYYLGWFKIISLAVCFFISFLVNVGAFGNGYIGFRYWTPPEGKFTRYHPWYSSLTSQARSWTGLMDLVKCSLWQLHTTSEQRSSRLRLERPKTLENPSQMYAMRWCSCTRIKINFCRESTLSFTEFYLSI